MSVSLDPWGIQESHFDAFGNRIDISPRTRAALHHAMGVEAGAPPPPVSVVVLREGESLPLEGPAEVLLEDGARRAVSSGLPADLPLGYHILFHRGHERRLIVGPGRCFFPEGLRTWGWAAQLYSVRSRSSWGIGDLADLKRLARWSAGLGAGLVLVNPLGAVNPLSPLQASPYFPGSRRFRNPLYLAIQDVPGAGEAGPELEQLTAAGTALNADGRIDRDAVFALKMKALELLWARFHLRSPSHPGPTGDAGFDAYVQTEGAPLAAFAVYCALIERHRRGWRSWPEEHRRPDAPAVARFAEENHERVRFHQWLQWLLERQAAAAAAEIRIVQDLPVGVDAEGADAWMWQDCFADGVTVGAPPDHFNAEGQDWGLPPFAPHRLRALGYEPFVQTLRAALRHGGGLRIDHVMGLFRLFWVPRGARPAEGAFVRYPSRDLLTIVALESHRAGAFIVGEDLGTVEDGVREELAERRILSYRLMWFEDRAPSEYPRLSLAAITTHDLPTVAGLWSGGESRILVSRGLTPNEEGTRSMLERLRSRTGLPAGADTWQAIGAAHRALGRSASAIVTATLEDALQVEERPNMPGTIHEWPNWSMALPETLEVLERDPRPRELATELAGARGLSEGE